MQLMKLVIFAIAMLLGTAAIAQAPINNNYGYTGSNPNSTSTTNGGLILNNAMYNTSDSDEVLTISGGKVFRRKVSAMVDSSKYATQYDLTTGLATKVNTSAISTNGSDSSDAYVLTSGATHRYVQAIADTKSPIINDSFGYQVVGSFLDFTHTYTAREGLLFQRNGIITNVFTADTNNRHVSSGGYLAMRQSRDSMKTFACYSDSCRRSIYNNIYDDRNFSAGQLDNGDIIIAFRQRQSGTVSTYGFIRMDSLGNHQTAFDTIAYPFTTDTDAPGFFGVLFKGDDGNRYCGFYATDSACIMQFLDTGFAVKVKFGYPGIAEPAIVNMGGNTWGMITRNETQNDFYSRVLWYSTDNFASLNRVGYVNIDTLRNKSLYRTPTGLVYDRINNKVLVLSARRNQLINNLAQVDSMRIDMATPDQFVNNTFTPVDIMPRTYMSFLTNYWYPSLVQIGNKIYGQMTMSYGSSLSTNPPEEKGDLYKFFINPVYPKSNGGLSVDPFYANLTVPRESKQKGIYSYIANPAKLNTDNTVLLDGQTLKYKANSWGFTPDLAGVSDGLYQVNTFNTKGINVAQIYNNVARTGTATFKHSVVGTGIHHDYVIRGAAYNGTWSFVARVGFFVNAGPVVQSSTTTQGFYAHLDAFTGTLPFDTFRAGIQTATGSDSVFFSIGDSTTLWTANSRIFIDMMDVNRFNGVSSVDPAWRGGWTSAVQPNYYSYVSSSVKKVFTKNLNESSALNGANITAASVPLTKLATQAANTLVGIGTGGGSPVALTLGNGLSISTTTLNSAVGTYLSNTATLDFPSTAAGAVSDLTITLTGAVLGDVVTLGVPNVSTVASGSFSAWVSATNTVKVRFENNNLVTALDPASGTFKVAIIR